MVRNAEDPDDMDAAKPSFSPATLSGTSRIITDEAAKRPKAKKESETGKQRLPSTTTSETGVMKSPGGAKKPDSHRKARQRKLQAAESFGEIEDEEDNYDDIDFMDDKPGALAIKGMGSETRGTVRIGGDYSEEEEEDNNHDAEDQKEAAAREATTLTTYPSQTHPTGAEQENDVGITGKEPVMIDEESGSTGLVVAELAPKMAECTLVPANEQPKGQQQEESENTNGISRKTTILIILVLISILIGIVILIVVLVTSDSGGDENNDSQLVAQAPPPSPSPTALSPTTSPTTANDPSMLRTISPTSAPSLEPTSTLDVAVSVFSPYIPGISNNSDGTSETTLSFIQQETLLWLLDNDAGLLNDEEEDETGAAMTGQLILERYSLAMLYLSTIGEDWTENRLWRSDVPSCSWFGITCDGNTDRVVSIDLRKFGIYSRPLPFHVR